MRNLRPVTETAPRAVIYLRQSVAKDDSISIEMQEVACRDYCDRMGYDVVDVKEDPGISGRVWLKRPKVQLVMQAIEEGTADVIVLWKWSRLSRSRKDWALAADRIDLAGGRIESATEPIDTATASGRFARGVMTEYAAFQSEQIGEVWEEVRQRRLRLGLPASGRLPYGWRWADGGIEQHPDQAPYVAAMFERYLAGEGSSEIAKWLNAEGIPGPNGNVWTRVRPFTVMDSPVHVGLIPYRGQTYAGAHVPLIPRETWDAYRAERETRRTRGEKPRQYAHLLSTLVWCGCGQKMFGKGSITGGHWYGGYICGRKEVAHPARAYVSALALDPLVTAWILKFDPDVDLRIREGGADRARRERLLREAGKLEDELAALTRQLVQNIVPESAYLRARAEIERDVAAITAEVRTLEAASRAVPSSTELYTLQTAWDEMTTQERNRALRALVDRITLAADGASATIRTHWGSSSVLHL
jgi:DNA invertase Pin-like site-specific DNA recombinase